MVRACGWDSGHSWPARQKGGYRVGLGAAKNSPWQPHIANHCYDNQTSTTNQPNVV